MKSITGELRLVRLLIKRRSLAAEMTYYADAPKDLVSVSELITQQQTILAKNGENARLRSQRDQLAQLKDNLDK